MIGLIQRVSSASVTVEGVVVGSIGEGLLLLLGVERGDTVQQADRLLQKVLRYRVFEDASGRMNRNLQEVGGGLLVVSQFTLVADTRKGLRPGFSGAADPELGRQLFDHFLQQARVHHPDVASGQYGANMRVSLCNEGPATFWLDA